MTLRQSFSVSERVSGSWEAAIARVVVVVAGRDWACCYLPSLIHSRLGYYIFWHRA